MIVISVALFMAGSAIVTYRFIDRSIARSELSFFKIFCQKVRSDAVAAGEEQSIELDAPTRSYRAGGMHVQLPTQVQFGTAPGVLGPPSNPINPITEAITFKDKKIVCFPDGRLSSGIVYFTTNDKGVTYALSNGVATLSYLRLYRYEQGKWVTVE